MVKLQELHFELFSPSTLFSRSTSSDYYQIIVLKIILQGNGFVTGEELLPKIKCVLRPKINWFILDHKKKSTEMIEKCWSECITLEEECVEE